MIKRITDKTVGLSNHGDTHGLLGSDPVAATSTGIIVLWSGSVATIPAGWALCDGVANAPGPNLTDRFIVGATALTALTLGGTVSPTLALPTHAAHVVGPVLVPNLGNVSNSPNGPAPQLLSRSIHTHPAPTITAHDAHPVEKWFALAYIQKMP